MRSLRTGIRTGRDGIRNAMQKGGRNELGIFTGIRDRCLCRVGSYERVGDSGEGQEVREWEKMTY